MATLAIMVALVRADEGCAEYECPPAAGEDGIVKDGCRGFFEFPSLEGEFTIWDSQLGETPNEICLGGNINAATTVNLENTDLTNAQLRFLTGEKVVAYGEYREEEGEATKYVFTKLVIYVLSRPKK
ncbi:MAG: hypothetical protein HYT37_03820 [Candidatus Sungbacteria bacterium]|nr:hypothetical protein [Candidatus Sungbacteria bacterium]